MRQLVLFGVIGVTQLVADTLIFYLLLKLSITPWIANSMCASSRCFSGSR